jgi:hypothetical protein
MCCKIAASAGDRQKKKKTGGAGCGKQVGNGEGKKVRETSQSMK